MNRDLEWQRRYEEDDTPWDKGEAAPPLVGFLRDKPISGRVLVPGCGRGHDARAVAGMPNTRVVGLDMSPLAIEQAQKLIAGSGPGQELSFVAGNFFELPDALRGSFDWLVEHTCFCAIEPRQRPNYVRGAASALRPKGRIFAIFYINPGVASGPPFAVSKNELAELFDPEFLLLEEWVPKESFSGRENRELVQILEKR